jgi:hypothetical protein
MSERRFIPPMQYAPPEVGRANHWRFGVKKFQNWRGSDLKIPGIVAVRCRNTPDSAR